MTNTSTSGSNNGMTTLDKMWKKVAWKNDDTTMEDIEEEQPSKTTNHSVQTGKNKETAKDNDNA